MLPKCFLMIWYNIICDFICLYVIIFISKELLVLKEKAKHSSNKWQDLDQQNPETLIKCCFWTQKTSSYKNFLFPKLLPAFLEVFCGKCLPWHHRNHWCCMLLSLSHAQTLSASVLYFELPDGLWIILHCLNHQATWLVYSL